eukprot:gene2644-2888_t
MALLVLLFLISLLGGLLGSSLSSSSICSEEGGAPAVEKQHISSPSPMTDFIHFFTHTNQFQLYPNFMTSMPVDISEGPDSYLIHVDLPGVEKDDIKLAISPSQHEMQISARKQSNKEISGQFYKRIERYTGHMTRTVYLPDKANLDQLSAEFNHGVLVINLPKITPHPDLDHKEIPIN